MSVKPCSTSPTGPPSKRLYTGWITVAGAALSFALSSGLMHAFTVFFIAFLDEFGWTRADASIAYALSLVRSMVSYLGGCVLVWRLRG